MQACEVYILSFFFFQKNADVSIFVEISGYYLEKLRGYLHFFFVDSNSPCKDLPFLRSPSLVQRLKSVCIY